MRPQNSCKNEGEKAHRLCICFTFHSRRYFRKHIFSLHVFYVYKRNVKLVKHFQIFAITSDFQLREKYITEGFPSKMYNFSNKCTRSIFVYSSIYE